MADRQAFEEGVRNLLVGCAGARAGDSLLILAEDPALGVYEAGLAEAIGECASRFGLDVRRTDIGFEPDAPEIDATLQKAIGAADHTLFLARLGDQLRFCQMPRGARPIVSYALDRASFASQFGGAPHAAMEALKTAFNALMTRARDIRVTCPLGTDFAGAAPASGSDEPADVTIRRFPMSVFAPLDARGFSGKVALGGFLLGTGSRYYEPYGLPLRAPLFARFEAGRLSDFEGDATARDEARAHYARVAAQFGIDADVVHSWHAGIHPACAFPGAAYDNWERWSCAAFGNPRILHFHTCGDYAPGEICWNVIDPTIAVDGVDIWRAGRIDIDRVPGAAAALDRAPGLRALFERPERRIGVGDDG
jgi:hypothetical protein